MSEISPNLARALARGDAPFLLFYCDHPTAPVYAWTRTGTLEWNGQRWQGLGIFGTVSGARRSTDISVNEVTFSLRGVPPSSTAMLSDQVRNRVAQVTRGAISKRGEVTVDDDPTIDALLEFQTLKIDPVSGTATIVLTGNQGFYLLDRGQDISYSDQQQRSEYEGDCGMALTYLLVNKDSNWRSA